MVGESGVTMHGTGVAGSGYSVGLRFWRKSENWREGRPERGWGG